MKNQSLPAVAVLLALAFLGAFARAQDAAKPGLQLFSSDSIWQVNRGTEFPGAKGTFTMVDQDSTKAGKLDYDFTGGGLYVSGVSNVDISDSVTEIHLSVKSATSQKIVVRLIDSTKQCLQYSMPYTAEGDWQTLRVDFKEKPGIFFAGAKDGVVHYPVMQIWLGAEKSDGNTQGEVLFKDAKALP